MERERDVIDTTILRSSGKYYRISKDETDSRLILEEADSLLRDFKQIACPFLKIKGREGRRVSFAGWQELVCDLRISLPRERDICR